MTEVGRSWDEHTQKREHLQEQPHFVWERYRS
jgi:hypothetical protein